MKKLLFVYVLLLVAFVLAGCIIISDTGSDVAASVSDTESDTVSSSLENESDALSEYEYTITEGKAVITLCRNTSLTNVVIPETLDGCPVEAIAEKAFYKCSSLASIEMPSVRKIGAHAFDSCENLTTVSMPKAQTIEGNAFYSCSSLTSVEMPNVKKIGDKAFANCRSLTSFILSDDNENFSSSDGILYNGDKTLLVCYPSAEGEIAIADSVTKIDNYAFYFCTSVTGVSMPSVKTLGDYSFSSCKSLVITEMPNVQIIGNYAFSSCDSLISISVPNAKTINDSAFFGCVNLVNSDMPSVKTIGNYAFRFCESLTDAYIPNVLSIGDGSFDKCISLSNVEMPVVRKVSGNSFLNTPWYDNLTDTFSIFGDGVLVKYCGTETEIIIPDNVKYVAGFYTNTDINTVSMPGVITVANNAFYYCSSLTVAEMPCVQDIGNEAFFCCHVLTEISMPKVKSIGFSAFYYCSFSKISFMNIKSIDSLAFSECNSLVKVYFMCDAPTDFGTDVFYNCADDFTIYFVQGTEGWTTPEWNGCSTSELRNKPGFNTTI